MKARYPGTSCPGVLLPEISYGPVLQYVRMALSAVSRPSAMQSQHVSRLTVVETVTPMASWVTVYPFFTAVPEPVFDPSAGLDK